MYTCIYVCIYICTHVCMYTYIHIYTYTYFNFQTYRKITQTVRRIPIYSDTNLPTVNISPHLLLNHLSPSLYMHLLSCFSEPPESKL